MTDLTPIQVAASTDDGRSWGTTHPGYGTSYNLNGTTIRLGADASYFYSTLFRFLGVAIPIGATITSAVLDLISDAASSVQMDVTLSCHDSDDSATLGTTSNSETGLPGYRTRTAASTRWNVGTGAWGAGATVTTPNFAPSVQEVCDRSGRAETFDLSVLIDNTATSLPGATQYRNVRSWDYAGNVSGAVLKISYTVAGGPKLFHAHFQGQGMI